MMDIDVVTLQYGLFPGENKYSLIGDSGATALADALRVNQSLKTLQQVTSKKLVPYYMLLTWSSEPKMRK